MLPLRLLAVRDTDAFPHTNANCGCGSEGERERRRGQICIPTWSSPSAWTKGNIRLGLMRGAILFNLCESLTDQRLPSRKWVSGREVHAYICIIRWHYVCKYGCSRRQSLSISNIMRDWNALWIYEEQIDIMCAAALWISFDIRK